MIRTATIDDISRIQQIAVTTWRHTYDGLLPPALQQQFLAFDYNYRQLHKRITTSPFFVVERAEQVVGFAHFSNEQRAELEALYVLPHAQQKGAGYELLIAGIKKLQPQKLYVRVLQTNKQAIQFYERQAFYYVSEEHFTVAGETFTIQTMEKMLQ